MTVVVLAAGLTGFAADEAAEGQRAKEADSLGSMESVSADPDGGGCEPERRSWCTHQLWIHNGCSSSAHPSLSAGKPISGLLDVASRVQIVRLEAMRAADARIETMIRFVM